MAAVAAAAAGTTTIWQTHTHIHAHTGREANTRGTHTTSRRSKRATESSQT